jgi:hypothetical protein
MSHICRSLHDPLDETLGFIGRALDRIRAGDGAESELHNVRVYLVNILELIERDPGIEAASDDLYQGRRCSPEVLTKARAWLACSTRRFFAFAIGSGSRSRASGQSRWG